jgi:GDP-D-mannose dehydratase
MIGQCAGARLNAETLGTAIALTKSFDRYRPGESSTWPATSKWESRFASRNAIHNNVVKSVVLIHSALAHEVEAFVFSSSCAVYGFPQTDLLSETHPIQPLSPYADSRICEHLS